MGLIWKSEDRPVSNYSATKARTSRMSERLGEEKARLCDEQIRTMINDGVVELAVVASSDHSDAEVPNGAVPPSGREESWADAQSPGLKPASPVSEFNLPHRGISRNGKLRIVFDGSAKDGVGQSLNEYLSPGDNLLAKLPSVLLNFRSGAASCQADIQAAFHQVSVDEEDRKYLQFFWADSCMRFARVPFGLTCSPYMLLKTVEIHLSQYAEQDPELCQLIHDSCYMDDLCLHFHDREEAVIMLARAKKIFSEAHMKLHKVRISGDASVPTTILGLVWHTESDELAVKVPETCCPTTKSQLLSAIARTFDPLGLLTPWLIGGKILFQRTWKEKRSGTDGHCHTLEEEPDVRQMGDDTESDKPENSDEPEYDRHKSDDGKDCLRKKLMHAFDEPDGDRVGSTSHDCWDPGGITFLSCPPSA